MREILFRGRSFDNGKMVYGSLEKQINIFGDEEYKIFKQENCDKWEYIQVEPETIGEYTGLKDKNGKLIFEEDIVKVTDDADELQNECFDTGIGIVEFYDGLWYVDKGANNALYTLDRIGYIEIIGNIHDNPELLQVQE